MSLQFLTVRAVADALACSPETILRRIRAGELPAIRLASNALRIRESELEAFLERSAVSVLPTAGVPSQQREESP